MPRTYKPKTERKNGKHKPQTLPATFRPGFLSTLDGRTDLAKSLRSNREAIIADIGGAEELSHIKSALVERFVWLEALLQTLEHEIAAGTTDKGEALGRWIQAINTLIGIARTLGIDRKARAMPWAELNKPTPRTESKRDVP